MYAAGIGAEKQPIRRNAVTHEASYLVIRTGESSANSFGNEGEDHPMATDAANIFIAAK